MVCLSSQTGALGLCIFRLAQFLALFPFRLNHDGLFLDPFLLAYVMVVKLVVGIHVLLIEEPAWYVSSVVAYCAVAVHSVIILFKRENLNLFLRQLSECEFSLLQLGQKSLIKKNYVFDYFLIVLNVFTILLDSILSKNLNVATFFEMWLNLSVFGVVHPFVHLVLVMHCRFSNLNEMLQHPCHYKASRFRYLTELHQQCVTACLTLHHCFTQQALWISGALFLYMTVTFYKILTVIEAAAGFIEIASKALSFVYFISIAFIICTACVKTSTEVQLFQGNTLCSMLQAKQFDILLHRWMIVDGTGGLARDEKLFLHIAMRQEIRFSAYNVFALDYTLIHSMIAAMTTYLVILIQVESSDSF